MAITTDHKHNTLTTVPPKTLHKIVQPRQMEAREVGVISIMSLVDDNCERQRFL